MVEGLETTAALARLRGEPRVGAVLLGAAASAREAGGAFRPPDEEAWMGTQEALLRAALGEAEYAAARADGAGLTLAEAHRLADRVTAATGR
jgi:hypothetical protein